MFLFFQLQATWAVLFALTILSVVSNKSTVLHATDYFAIVIWCTSITGEYFANCKISNISEGAMNADDADRLWEKSLNLTGLKYPGI